MVTITVGTTPTGRSFSVDGTTYTTQQVFSWVGFSHTIATTSPQSGGTGIQYLWTKWSDNGAISHAVAPTKNTIYAATFKTQYFLTMNAGSGGTVTPGSGYQDAGRETSRSKPRPMAASIVSWTGSGTAPSPGRATRPRSA